MNATKQPQKRKKPLTDAYLNSLPLWKLLSIAMVDLRKQERAKKSSVNMLDWLVLNGECSACMAGSVMRFSCDIKETVVTASRKWAYAIDSLRRGTVSYAILNIGRSSLVCFHTLDRTVASYCHDRAAFWRDIRKLRDDLKKAGL